MQRRTIYRLINLVVLLLAFGMPSPAQDDNVPPLPTVRMVPERVVDSLKRDDDFAYANDDSYLNKEKTEVSDSGSWDAFYAFFGNNNVRAVAYILLALFFIFVIYRIIIKNNLFLFYSSKKVRAAADDEEEEGIRDENIDDKINKAVKERDYRSAIRYYYIKGLQLLNNRGLIRYHAQATNHEYVYQLSQTPVAGDFSFLTQVYDFVWYGEFAVNDEQFARLQSDFKKFYQAVK